jgi:hypothetical protein
MLDIVGDHGVSTDGFNDNVGLLEGCTDNDSIDEGRDETVGSTVNDGVDEGTDEGESVGDSVGHPLPNRVEI